jgi:hypothetical protein
MHTLLGLDEATLTNASWFCYFLALLAFIGLLVAQATQLSRRRVLAREEIDFGGVQPVFATAGAGANQVQSMAGATSPPARPKPMTPARSSRWARPPPGLGAPGAP